MILSSRQSALLKLVCPCRLSTQVIDGVRPRHGNRAHWGSDSKCQWFTRRLARIPPSRQLAGLQSCLAPWAETWRAGAGLWPQPLGLSPPVVGLVSMRSLPEGRGKGGPD